MVLWLDHLEPGEKAAFGLGGNGRNDKGEYTELIFKRIDGVKQDRIAYLEDSNGNEIRFVRYMGRWAYGPDMLHVRLLKTLDD